MKHVTETDSVIGGNSMTEFIKKPMVQLIKELGITGVLILTLYGGYKAFEKSLDRQDKMMLIVIEQQKENNKTNNKVAIALNKLTNNLEKD